VLILKIKQAECALADGRLDEAYDLLQPDNMQQHRHGQKIIGKLIRALARRGQDHLAAGRVQQALTDCNKADRLGGNLPEIAQLRTSLCQAMEQKQHKEQHQQAQLAVAQQHLENGRISVSEQILANNQEEGNQVKVLVDQAAAKRVEVNEAVAQIDKALQQDDVETALDILARNADLTGHQRLTDLAGDVRKHALDSVLAHLNQGRIDLAGALLHRTAPVANHSARFKEISSAVAYCQKAASAIGLSNPHDAAELLQRLHLILPSAKWLGDAIEQAQKASDQLNHLRIGPLGLIAVESPEDLDMPENEDAVIAPKKLRDLPGRPSPVGPEVASLPSQFVLQVDGVGSFLVIPKQALTVGPISSSARPDLGLLVNPHLPSVTIEREDEDYFLTSSQTISVDNAATNRKLLNDGDRIRLSEKCRIKFNLPNAASTTATLVLSGARLPRPDINYVILMDREMLIGPGCNNHIRATSLQDTMALTLQKGRLICKSVRKQLIDGQPVAAGTALPMNRPVKLDRLSLVLTELN
jgi:tetratricopeptide (TPR) repeat protein